MKGADGNDYNLSKTGNDLTIATANNEILAIAKNFKSGDLGITLGEAVKVPPVVFTTLPTPEEVTSMYLYGQKTPPQREELASDGVGVTADLLLALSIVRNVRHQRDVHRA